nr:hypothetical protein [Tanacetum cinerariifolium]
EEFNLEYILQIQDVILREKLLSINRLIADIKFLNDNPTSNRVLKSFASFLIFEKSDNSLPKFETFSDHTEETRSGSTTAHVNNSLAEYDSFCFEIKPNQERLTSVVMKDISDNSTNDSLLEEIDLFLASDNSIPPGIENFDYDSEGDIHFLKELLVNDSISFSKNESSNFDHHNDPSFSHSSTFDVLKDHYEILSEFNNDDISSDGDAFEDIEYIKASLPDFEIVRLEEENDVYQEKEEFNLEYILQIQDVILREKLLSINRLIADIKFLNDNPTSNRVLKSFASFLIFEKSDNSLPKFETFSDHTEETRSGEVIATMINNIYELNEDECFDPGSEIDVFSNVEDDDYFPFMFVI